jgi:hypothetical protein
LAQQCFEIQLEGTALSLFAVPLVIEVVVYINCADVTLQASPHPGTPGSTVGAPPTTYPGLAPTPDTDGPIKIERLSGTTASKY